MARSISGTGGKGLRPTGQGQDQNGILRLLAELLRLLGIGGRIDPAAWADEIHTVKPGGPAVRPRIQMRDGGWVEADRKAGVIRTWGRPGRAQDLAAVLAEATGWDAEHLDQTGAARRPGAPGPFRAPPSSVTESLTAWWQDRGYAAESMADGTWVDIGGTHLRDVGDTVSVHGDVTDATARAMIMKAREAWGGGLELTGTWSPADRDRMWIEAQRQGVELHGVEPSQAARDAWMREQDTAAARTETLGMVRAGTAEARLLRDAAGGDTDALEKLPVALRAFVSGFLDDEQRKELAGFDIADVLAELPGFKERGLEEIERLRAETGTAPDFLPVPPKPDADASPKPRPREP
ncbi:MAG: LPD7 domain-containing protein [Pseudomonadota bacterium]